MGCAAEATGNLCVRACGARARVGGCLARYLDLVLPGVLLNKDAVSRTQF